MVDPIRVESLFQEVLAELETTISIRYRYRLFKEFIIKLNGEYQRFETYIIQLTEEIPVYSLPLNWSGLDPQEIEEDIDLFEILSKELQLPEEYTRFSEIITHLREVCILLYCCLDEYSKANKHLSYLCDLHFLRGHSHHQNDSLLTVFHAWIRDAVSKKQSYPKKARDTLQRLYDQSKFIERISFGSALIPVVERYEHSESTDVQYGRLRLLSVEIYGTAKYEDQLIRNFRVFGAEQPVNHQKKAPLAAARTLFESRYSNINDRFFNGGIGFELSGAIHDGNSANFAISALWYAALFEATEQRQQYKVNPQIAITGDINEQGHILSVDEKTINLKVKASFFSWARQLVVPNNQLDKFEIELQELKKKYPSRNLDLIGIHHLKELFFDRRLAIHQVQRWIKYYFNRAKSQKYRVVTIPLIVLLLIVIGRLFFGPVDQNPVAAEFRGSNMILQNQFGQEIKTLEVGSRVVNSNNSADAANFNNKVIFYDLNNDDLNEVFYAKSSNSSNEQFGEKVIAYSISGDSLIWEKILRFDLQFPNKQDVGNDSYRVYNLVICKNPIDSLKNSLIVNAGHYNLFPSILLQMDSNTGNEISRYVHTGRISQIISEDINGDQFDEIIGIGQNNAFDQFTVVFQLESNKVKGISPTTEEYRIDLYESAQETVYIKIPQTVVGRQFATRVLSNNPKYIRLDKSNRTIEVRVSDFRLTDPNPFELSEADVIIDFNYDFQVQSIGTDSKYDIWVKNLNESGRIPFEPDHEYFEAFQDSLLYWNGEGFVLKNELMK